VYFVDEAAHLEHQELVDAALTENTRCRIDISSVAGYGNVFHRRREAGVDWSPGLAIPSGKTRVFVFDWSQHPDKTRAWYEEKRQRAEDEGLLHNFAQEIDRDYAAAVENAIIPETWIRAAVDIHKDFHWPEEGNIIAALDVADMGGDTNALAQRRGPTLQHLSEWGERDTGETTRKVVAELQQHPNVALQYDAAGVGAGVKAELNRLRRDQLLPRGLLGIGWQAGGKVLHPDRHVVEGDRTAPLNKDFYMNLKAQGWWMLRRRFEQTYRYRHDDTFRLSREHAIDDLISLPQTLPLLHKLIKELTQPTYSQSSSLKLIVDKTPEGMRSPNLADAVMMVYWPLPGGITAQGIPDSIKQWARIYERKNTLGTLRY
jgi:hypothetical protein